MRSGRSSIREGTHVSADEAPRRTTGTKVALSKPYSFEVGAMDRPPALVIDDIVGSAVTIDGAIVLISLNAAGYLIDLAFPAAKAEELVTVLAGALEKAARNHAR
jgi:hypothetical protein